MDIRTTPESSIFLVVAAALISSDRRVFVQQRPADKQHGGLWEFPGGKVESGETPEAALARELREELGVIVSVSAMLPLSFATSEADHRHLVLLLYRILKWSGEPQAMAADSMRWVDAESLRKLAMPPADLPLVDVLTGVLDASSRRNIEI